MTKVLIVGASGYVGKKMTELLAEEGFQVIALVRKPESLAVLKHLKDRVLPYVGNLLDSESLRDLPKDIKVAYYFAHSMKDKGSGFHELEAMAAENFNHAISNTSCRQIVYLSGLSQGDYVSEHMQSRHQVEEILRQGKASLTVFRSGIIIGEGSASFEIMRDLVEKLPVMIAPKWTLSRCQPIAIFDVLYYLKKALNNPSCFDKSFEIGGKEQMTYKEMLKKLAAFRGLSRYILTVPVLTPKLSSYWLVFITKVKFSLAYALVKSLRTNAVCQDDLVTQVIPHACRGFKESLNSCFSQIEQNALGKTWESLLKEQKQHPGRLEYLMAPSFGCIKHIVEHRVINEKEVLERLFMIGGKNGWYAMNWAWKLRGWIDRMLGGPGMSRGRIDEKHLKSNDILDCWRVLFADEVKKKLLLYAEMKMPGEAWLEYYFEEGNLKQTATFRPKGLLGRFYWYALLPLHLILFDRLCKKIAQRKEKNQ